ALGPGGPPRRGGRGPRSPLRRARRAAGAAGRRDPDSARVHAVRRVPVSSPAPAEADEHYLATAPGEYPDLLEPLGGEEVRVGRGLWEALWIDVIDAPPGEHTLTLALTDTTGEQVLAEHAVQLRVHPHQL